MPDSDKLADGSIPIDPANTEASSVRISPNMFSVTITSIHAGPVMSFIAALSTVDAQASHPDVLYRLG
jgi:hypothetical protein